MTDTRMQPKQKNKFHRECRFVFLYFWVFVLLDFGFFGILDFWFFGFYTAKPKMKNKQNTKNNRNTKNNKTVPAFSVNLWFLVSGPGVVPDRRNQGSNSIPLEKHKFAGGGRCFTGDGLSCGGGGGAVTIYIYICIDLCVCIYIHI